ncbi:hypothetical protein CC86DRAFT_426324 [Ophiobolus disseminans]|uniref:Uncharacterized protein n=1 Tax=Ophiobolus disseminans TaxID=1469910 RepID=A0A6A6ZM15_9PLEO|nr:hypothetical protein CC86DRAFT_426324 [Ophiobolus disseminans]
MSTGASDFERLGESSLTAQPNKHIDVTLSVSTTRELTSLVSGLNGYVQENCPAFSKFLDLPLEFREKIYMQHLVVQNFRYLPHRVKQTMRSLGAWTSTYGSIHYWLCIIVDCTYDTNFPLILALFMPDVTRTCHRVRAEVFRVMLRHSEKVVAQGRGGVDYTTRFLDSFEGAWPFEIIHTLHFAKFETFGADKNTALELLARCPNVRTLILAFSAASLCQTKSETWPPELRLLDDILDIHDIRRIGDCNALRRVRLEFLTDFAEMEMWGWYLPMDWNASDYTSTLTELGRWILEFSRERGSDVKVGTAYRIWGEKWIGDMGETEIV